MAEIGVNAYTLSRSVGALERRDEHLVAIQLPPDTAITVVGPADGPANMVTVQTQNGVDYLVFASDLESSIV